MDIVESLRSGQFFAEHGRAADEITTLRKAVRYFAGAYDNPARLLAELGLTTEQITLILQTDSASPIPRHPRTPFG